MFALAHKITSGILILVILGGGYYTYKKVTSTAGENRYVTAKAEKGTIVASVSGTGQVSDVNQIDLKAKASGDIVYIGAKNGDQVGAGALIIEIDPSDAQKAVRDADASLTSAKLALEKFKITNSEANLSADALKAYNDGFSAVSDTFLDLPSIVTGVEDILDETALSDNAAGIVSSTARDYRTKAESSYFLANSSFKKSREAYTALSINSPKADIENIIKQTYITTQILSDTLKNMITFVDYMSEHSSSGSAFSQEQSSLTTYINTVNGHQTALLAAGTNIENTKDTSQNTDLDLQSAELAVTQKENALVDAKDKLADYFLRAPYAGTIAGLDLKKGDSVSTSTAVASLVTPKQLALISLNEVDVAKIKVGQKATLTFDAIPDLTISGEVTEIDPIGTVSQGVVTYDVKINFDTEDSRVKTGMSVSAAVITDMKQDVLEVPNSAVKSQGGQHYVEMFDAPLVPPTDGLIGSISLIAPNKVPVEIGISNDSATEIISGINEGDEIVTRTISGTTVTAAAPSLFGSPTRATTGGAAGGARGGTFRAN